MAASLCMGNIFVGWGKGAHQGSGLLLTGRFLLSECGAWLMHWFLAAVHLLAFAVAFAAVTGRGTALRRMTADRADVRRALLADNGWGLAAAVLLITGLMRAFAGYEKGTDFYLHQPLFHLKMTLFVIILLLELWPMVTLIKWRIGLGRGLPIDVGRSLLFARISHVQALLILLMVIAATGMARGVMSSQV